MNDLFSKNRIFRCFLWLMTCVWGGVGLGHLSGCVGAVSREAPKSFLPLDFVMLAGVWFDIAHLPHRVEEDCTDTAILFEPGEDPDSLLFIFECHKEGAWYNLQGRAQADEDATDLLVVEFDDSLVDSNVNFAFWVVAIDPEKKWMVAAHPDEDWFWIMSRVPIMEEQLRESILADAVKNGHLKARSRASLELTPHPYSQGL